MSIFGFSDYKIWFKALIQALPKGGRGQFRRLAEHLSISPTIVTQIFNGDREISPEQAVLLADYLGLAKIESRFLLLLVHHARAGSHKYRLLIEEEIEEVRKSAQEIKSHVSNSALTDEAKSILYSNWYYLAIWSLVAIGGLSSAQEFAKRLSISPKKAAAALDFLKKFGLVAEDTETGKLRLGHTLFHLESDSPQIPRHHQSWRLKAFQTYELPDEDNLSYTAPVTLSREDAILVRKKLLKLIRESVDLIKDSPSEELFCLCMDWYRI